MSEAVEEITMFERLGGPVVLDRLVERFYELMDTLPEAEDIRAMHPDDLGQIKIDLKRYLTEWTGGPKLYSPEKTQAVGGRRSSGDGPPHGEWR